MVDFFMLSLAVVMVGMLVILMGAAIFYFVGLCIEMVRDAWRMIRGY